MIREKSTKTQVVGFNFYYCIQQVVGTHHLLPAVPHDHVEAVGAALGQLHPVPVLHTTQSDCYVIRNIVITNGKQGPHQTKQKAVTTDNISHHRQQRRYQTQQTSVPLSAAKEGPSKASARRTPCHQSCQTPSDMKKTASQQKGGDAIELSEFGRPTTRTAMTCDSIE